MDWSMDPPQTPILSSPCFAPASEHVPLPHVPLHNKGSNSKNRTESTALSVLNYGERQLAIKRSWNRAHHTLSIFRMEDTILKNTEMIFKSIRRIRTYIKHHPADKTPGREFVPVVEYLWKLINTIYAAKWDTLIFDKAKTLTIRKCVRECIMPLYRQALNTMTSYPSPLPSAEAALPPTTNMLAAPSSPNKTIEITVKKDSKPLNMKKSYAQASKSNLSYIKDIV